MTAIASLSDLVNRLTGGSSGTPETLAFFKTPRVQGAAPTAPIAGRLASLWRYDGSPSGGAAPTTVAVPDNTTTGGLKQTDPGGGRQKWLHSVMASGLVPGTLILYDRLLHIGNLSGTTTTAQTVGGALTRYTNGAGNFVFAEIYTTVGTTATTITMSYTNQAGTSGRTSQAVAFGGSGFREDTRAVLLPLADGDTGVQAVASTTVLASTGTAGNFGIVVGHVLATVEIGMAGLAGGRTFAQGLPGLPEVLTDACLAWLWMPNSTTTPEIVGMAQFLEA
jgi:hypothetical protein